MDDEIERFKEEAEKLQKELEVKESKNDPPPFGRSPLG
jgi:hypothetical protein